MPTPYHPGSTPTMDTPFAYHEGRITIDFGLTEHGGLQLSTTIECPVEPDELPHRILVEGALTMARDSLDELYNGGPE